MAGPVADPAAEAVAAVLTALADGDTARLGLLLHPYLHWPREVELRDGQVYRWTC